MLTLELNEARDLKWLAYNKAQLMVAIICLLIFYFITNCISLYVYLAFTFYGQATFY